MSLITPWSPFFQSTARSKGRSLRLSEKVDRRHPVNGQLLHAAVRDGTTTHTVTVEADGRYAAAECDCDAFRSGAFCPHIWAALLDAEHNTHGQPVDLAELARLRPRPPKATRRDRNRPRPVHREPAWAGRLTLLQQSAIDRQLPGAAPILPMQRQIVYAVLPGHSTRHNGLVIEVRQRHAIATGWSRPRPMRISNHSSAGLTDPTDRELCALLLGAQWIRDDSTDETGSPSRSHATFRVAPGAARGLLKRMIATGRCIYDLSEDDPIPTRPVRWDSGQPAADRPAGAVDDLPWKLVLVGTEAADELIIDLQLRRGDQRIAIDRPELVLGGPDGLILCDGTASAFDDHDAFRWVSQFRDERYEDPQTGSRGMRIASEQIPRFLERLYLLPQLPDLDLPDHLSRTEQQIAPQPHIELFSPGSAEQRDLAPGAARQHMVARVWFHYAGTRINPAEAGRFVPAVPARDQTDDPAPPATDSDTEPSDHTEPASPPAGRLLRRDRRAERQAMASLAQVGFRQAGADHGNTLLLSTRDMPRAVATLLDRGWSVHADRLAMRGAGPPALSITSGIDWFELRGDITYTRADGETQTIGLPQILKAARSGVSLIQLDDGSHGLLPEQWLREHGLLTAMGDLRGDHLRYRRSQGILLDALLDQQPSLTYDPPFARAREVVRHFAGIEPLDPAPDFHGSLRPYQREGLGWMRFLRDFGMGGILADDMGLGKTIQVLAMVLGRRAAATNTEPPLPTLIVAPRSVIFNWIDEAARFTPQLNVIAYTGPDRAPLRDRFAESDLIVTSYGLLRRDIEPLLGHAFDYVVLDEAQAIKNPTSQSAKACRLLQARHRLALTGTPIENHLGDIWSIFEFLNPGMLGASARFGELARRTADTSPGSPSAAPDSADHCATEPDHNADSPPAVRGRSTMQQVATALRPFICRRTKKQVLKDLPEKTEQTIHCDMDPAQRAIYDQLRTYYRGSLLNRLDAGSASGRVAGRDTFMVLEALLRLRQAACHPALISGSASAEAAGLAASDAPLPSAKLDVLDQQLDEIIQEGSKALVFSQFTRMLALVRERLDARGIPYAYLDGQTRDRREQVARFQTDPDLPVFLISLKAGGTGLNLTAAEYVFILDPWWNPAVEAQAIDRTHRIGQNRPVFAYRLICEDTVEQRILELQQKKRQLADAIVGGDENLLRQLTREDIEQLLA